MTYTLPHLLVRADCSAAIGAGHLFRCLALAHAWMVQGGKVTFLSHCESEVLRARLQQDGIRLIPLDYSHPEPVDLEHAVRFLNQLRLENPSCRVWTVLDGYHFDTKYHQAIRQAGSNVMVIDDTNHLTYYDANVLLNQNIHAHSLSYNIRADTLPLFGTAYVLLRPEFLKYRTVQRKFPPIASKVLLTLGGADPDNVTVKVIKALNQVDIPGMEATVVIGPTNQHEDDVRKKLEQSHFKWRLLHAPDNMPELMEWADLAVSAGGTTCWELAFMGIPTIVIVTSDNQKEAAETMARKGVTLCMGWHDRMNIQYLAKSITNIARKKHLRAGMNWAGRKLVDGYGAEQVINTMIAYSEKAEG